MRRVALALFGAARGWSFVFALVLVVSCIDWGPGASAATDERDGPTRPRVIVSSDFPPLDVIPGKGCSGPPEKCSDPDEVPDDPSEGGWGGQLVRPDSSRKHWFDDPAGPETVYRWRPQVQKEFAHRADRMLP